MLPILPTYGESHHPSSDWVKVLETRQQAWLGGKSFAESLSGKIERRMLVDWTFGALHPDHPDLVREHIADWLSDDAAGTVEAEGPKGEALRFRRAALTVKARASALPTGDRDALTKEDLLDIYRRATGHAATGVSDMLRCGEGVSKNPLHQPASPAALPVLLDLTLDWFSTDSFAEMHPVERASLFHLRMLDLQPFARHNDRLTLLAASFYLLRAELPPLIFLPEDRQVYDEVVGYAFQMITQPSVEFFSRLAVRAFDRLG